ncbi:CHAT domain-containing protein [Mesorhizobium sp. ORM16]|uniref:CHAT domain-containing protein n=1 Tax=Mesorhizobium sp. ORM16 TaxID=3376989 RepID=UPI0038575CD8
MEEIQRLCARLGKLVKKKSWDEALPVAKKLWDVSRRAKIVERDLSITCARTLFTVADLFSQMADDSYSASLVLRRAYDLAAEENQVDISRPSLREYASHRLGLLFELAKCHQSAVVWFKRSLALARERGVQDQVLANLYGVAWNLELQKKYDEPRSFYDEILGLLWPTIRKGLLLQRLRYLLPAAMYHISNGDQQLGENVMLTLKSLLPIGRKTLPGYFAAGLLGLGNFYLANRRRDDAIGLARLVVTHAMRFGDDAGEIRDLMHGVMARAALQVGDFDNALAEIGKVFDLNSPESSGHGPGTFVDNLELWRDVGRIRAHRRDFVGAANAYETLAQALGAYAADWRNGKTARTRLAYVRLQADVVHELVSVWIMVDDPAARQAIDLTVANALLQLKANQFLATEGNRLVTFRDWEGVDKVLFRANRRFAAAARRLAADPEDLDAALELDDALFAREQLESQMVGNSFEMIPSIAHVFHFDFRELQSVKYGKHTLLDYSLVEIRPPQQGLAGTTAGKHYIGIKLSENSLRVEDLGPQEQLDALSISFTTQASRRPSLPLTQTQGEERHLVAKPDPHQPHESMLAIAEKVYQKIVEPLEPIGKSVVVAPDGSLAALPFHALVRNGRYLIEELEISNCHSLLQEEAIAYRQRNPGMRISIDVAGVNRDVILLGDPDYSGASVAALPNTRVEVEGIARLLIDHGWSDDDIHKYLGAEATASQVFSFDHPRVLHVAAHGSYQPAAALPVSNLIATPATSWRRWDERESDPLSDLDRALLRAVLLLSPQKEFHSDRVAGRLLTALELSSLNLIACRLAVLSACESGIGQPERGAGVLGFQYALLASFAHAGLVSLWSVPDRDTSDLMSSLYRSLVSNSWDVRRSYLATLRGACRCNGKAVHPYFWAAFVLLGSINR